jgi:hypothetical protein
MKNSGEIATARAANTAIISTDTTNMAAIPIVPTYRSAGQRLEPGPDQRVLSAQPETSARLTRLSVAYSLNKAKQGSSLGASLFGSSAVTAAEDFLIPLWNGRYAPLCALSTAFQAIVKAIDQLIDISNKPGTQVIEMGESALTAFGRRATVHENGIHPAFHGRRARQNE